MQRFTRKYAKWYARNAAYKKFSFTHYFVVSYIFIRINTDIKISHRVLSSVRSIEQKTCKQMFSICQIFEIDRTTKIYVSRSYILLMMCVFQFRSFKKKVLTNRITFDAFKNILHVFLYVCMFLNYSV